MPVLDGEAQLTALADERRHQHAETILGYLTGDHRERLGELAPVPCIPGGDDDALGGLEQSFGGAACLADGAASPQPSQSLACDLATRCSLLAADDDCRPADPLDGSDAVEMIRRTLKLLGRS